MFSRQTVFCAVAVTLSLVSMVWAQNGKPGGGNGAVHMQFSFSNPANDKPVTVTISGKVTDAKTLKPVPDALVRGSIYIADFRGPDVAGKCPHQQTRTDAAGTYQLTFTTRLSSGSGRGNDYVLLDASHSGYGTTPHYIGNAPTITKSNLNNIDIAIGPGKRVEGQVVDEQGNPIEGAHMKVENGWNGSESLFESLGQATTDAAGRFEIWCSTDTEKVIGQPWLRVYKPGYGTGFYWNLLKDEPMGRLTLPQGGTIAGRVVSQDRKGLAGVDVVAYDIWPNEVGRSVTGEDGRYELRGILGSPGFIDFYKKKNGKYFANLANVTIYARVDAGTSLHDSPQLSILAKQGQTLQASDLAVGDTQGVSGKVLPGATTFGVQGLLVRLDGDWDNMTSVDADGNFRFKSVSPGKHRLAVYLPTNLRYDPGIGRTEIKVEAGQSLVGVQIKLDQLAEVRVQILDSAGSPLEGITAGATWSKSGDGMWTEGTRSDKDGNAVVYVYPEKAQYIRGFDMDGKLVSEGFEKVEAKPAQVIEGIRIVMVPPAQLTGRLVVPAGATLEKKRLLATLKYADGNEQKERLKLDPTGRFRIERLVPGVVSLSLESIPAEFAGATAQAVEIQPGQAADLGDISLTRVKMYTVTGRLVPSPTFDNLQGFKVRLDLMQWEPMVDTDAEGRFTIPNVPAGKHRITAYLPYNLRTDRGVGHTEVVVKDKDLADAKLPLETLATIRMKIVDESGKPLEGVSAAAWWSADHSGVFTEGTKSDPKGIAMLYVYPGELQYVGAHDWDRRYTLKADRQFTLKAGQAVPTLTVVMTPASGEEQGE